MSTPQVVTRFAPSPTGYLHIGGARTALFNWLYARAKGGKFLLRIEDTDRERYTPAAAQAILDGLAWLGLEWDEEPTSQFAGAERHRAVANEMLANGSAYKCFSTKEEIEAYREQAREDGHQNPFPSPWRDADPADHPDAPFVIRLRAPREGGVAIKDMVQKKVSWAASSFDDLILLRSDGTPTYMLAVVVDDHDMGVTHVIRGDDHLINAGRQSLIYKAMGWDIPVFAHIPLIHGEDGKKLSKRHGATGVEEYAAMGYMPEAMRNYLARLGWSHGNDELFSTEQAIEWFDFNGMGKSPSRLDFKKLDNVSAHHIKIADDQTLTDAVLGYMSAANLPMLTEQQTDDLKRAMPYLRERSKKLPDVLEKAAFILSHRPIEKDEKSMEILNSVSKGILKRLTTAIQDASWNHESLMQASKTFAESENLKLGELAQPIRAALSGKTVSPSVFDMMLLLGRDETIARLEESSV
ncbi:glutamate--tRNA ligase [Amylibacter kogurei]|uniref:Glutamate--tRNA ligase n=1 Tax=Paramylibacter kogurei TaxID=1889778 RepID=A0A2G5K5K9_9RHOB|nr:glutamate--tRNA ligase [Amylibacter kogurei]PIB24827.1 glutamate--tRNA ligase [Amylibacter kogurei]